SRRRHTRSDRDWSSDVCSSDLGSTTATKDFQVDTNVAQFIRPGGGNYQVFFNNARTENRFTQAQVTSGAVTGGAAALYSSSLGRSEERRVGKEGRGCGVADWVS